MLSDKANPEYINVVNSIGAEKLALLAGLIPAMHVDETTIRTIRLQNIPFRTFFLGWSFGLANSVTVLQRFLRARAVIQMPHALNDRDR